METQHQREDTYPLPDTLDAIHIQDGTQYNKDHFTISQSYRDYVDYVLIPDGFIKDRVERMAQKIHNDYKGKEVTLLVIMNSAFRFFTDLLHYLNKLNEHSQEKMIIRPHFIKITTQKLNVAVVDQDKIIVPVQSEDIDGKHILVVEDIFDSGATIIKVKEKLESLAPATLKFATLFHKKNPKNLIHNYYANYIGFVLPDVFVIGYGMDYNEYYRDLTHLCVINKEGIDHYK